MTVPIARTLLPLALAASLFPALLLPPSSFHALHQQLVQPAHEEVSA
jgi:preprotein translocase subunit SecB